MIIRTRFVSSALLAVLVLAPHAQTQAPEIIWKFEAGG